MTGDFNDSMNDSIRQRSSDDAFENFYDFYSHDLLKKYSQVTPQYKIYRKRLKKISQPKEEDGAKPVLESQHLVDEDNGSEVDSYEGELDEMDMFNAHKSKIDQQKKINQEKVNIISEESQPINKAFGSAPEEKEEQEESDQELKQEFIDDPVTAIRNEDLINRVCNRNKGPNGDAEKYFDILLSGTSATIIIICGPENDQNTTRKIHIAWTGDCPALIWGNQRETFLSNTPLHQPSVDAERFRIYNDRGEIRETDDGVQRVFLRGRMYPGIKTSRSIGDLIPHQIGVTSEPDVLSSMLSSNDKILAVGTSSLFDQLGTKTVMEKLQDIVDLKDQRRNITTHLMTHLRESENHSNTPLEDVTFLVHFLQ